MPSFFETLIRPDREENEERALVARAANILEIGEFQILQIAYYEWFGEEMPEAMTDHIFRTFMMQSQVPHWAKHFARQIIDEEQKGTLDERSPYYHRYDSDYYRALPLGARRLAIAVGVIVLFVGGGILISHLTVTGSSRSTASGSGEKGVEIQRQSTSITVPYWSEDELRPAHSSDKGSGS